MKYSGLKKILLTYISFCALIQIATSQTKYEKEYRINIADVPESSVEFIERLQFSKRIKWYKEFGINKTSIEAKTKHHSKRYSVEFNSEGTLEDIEIQIKKKEIAPKTFSIIQDYLAENYDKHKFCKIQIQLTGEKEKLIAAVVNQNIFNNSQVITNYEIVAKVKIDGTFKEVEFLFDEAGNMIKRAFILQKNTDVLEF